MKVADFDYALPDELIARYPTPERTASRLLVLEGETRTLDKHFSDLLEFIEPNDCLIFNNTRVMPARLFGAKASGGRVECLIERVLTDTLALCHLRASKSPKQGTELIFGEARAEVTGREEAFYLLTLKNGTWFELMHEQGELPLPPYMERSPEAADANRYQTVYSAPLGAVAAPTAGLHFDECLLEKLKTKGVGLGFVTLHVGAGTFLPIRVEAIAEHQMHKEWAEVPQSVVDLIQATRARGGRVIAVGTTSVRSLETAAREGEIQTFSGDTNIFIYPGYEFKVVDAMITNFHLPQSTLMMLVSAFMGKDRIFTAYEYAVEQRYRFFSYGDAMLLIPPSPRRMPCPF